MRVAVLFSGGKDSVLALHRVLNEGYQVSCLVSMIPQREDSWMFHYPNIRLVDLSAEAVELPIVKAETVGAKEAEIDDLRRVIEKLDVEGIVSGAVASNYQKTRMDQICSEFKLKSIAPLWQQDQLSLLKELLKLKFEVIITGAYAYGFNKEWLGRKIDEQAIEDLEKLNSKYGVSLVGEGGEYESFVLNAPLFKKRIRVISADRIWKSQSGHYIIAKAELQNKQPSRASAKTYGSCKKVYFVA
jgi:ABC transporter with metal-binding/Fe-S-binding domain ATP-binding protein